MVQNDGTLGALVQMGVYSGDGCDPRNPFDEPAGLGHAKVEIRPGTAKR